MTLEEYNYTIIKIITNFEQQFDALNQNYDIGWQTGDERKVKSDLVNSIKESAKPVDNSHCNKEG